MLTIFRRLLGHNSLRGSRERRLFADPAKSIAVALTDHGQGETLRISFADADSDRRVVLHLPKEHWLAVSRVLTQLAGFQAVKDRRAHEESQRVSGKDYRAGAA